MVATSISGSKGCLRCASGINCRREVGAQATTGGCREGRVFLLRRAKLQAGSIAGMLIRAG